MWQAESLARGQVTGGNCYLYFLVNLFSRLKQSADRCCFADVKIGGLYSSCKSTYGRYQYRQGRDIVLKGLLIRDYIQES